MIQGFCSGVYHPGQELFFDKKTGKFKLCFSLTCFNYYWLVTRALGNRGNKKTGGDAFLDIHYRHEWKHEITCEDLLVIRSRLSVIAKPDPHARDGSYQIRSLYFDNLSDKALREKTDGVDRREKFRIRYYDGDTSLIHLEKKSKLNGLGTKYSAPLTPGEAERIVKGDIDFMLESPHPLIRELYCKMRYQGLKPRTIVDYVRQPYIYPPGNVRVTFDHDIRTGLGCTDFLNPDCPMIPAGKPMIIMEVKWDEFLPSIIRDAVQVKGRKVTAFSKYARCRIYG